MTTQKERMEIKETLRAAGRPEFFYNPPPKSQYWNKDGIKLPNLLPSDAHSLRYYLSEKGFTLTPPEDGERNFTDGTYADTMVGSPAKIDAIDNVDAIMKVREDRRMKLALEAATAFETTAPTPDTHEHVWKSNHRFTKCQVEGYGLRKFESERQEE